MRLQVPKVDARTRMGGRLKDRHSVIDFDTGKEVGYLLTALGNPHSGTPRRLISLFDGKYCAWVDTHEECWAFAKGVEAVLNHITSTGEQMPKAEAV